MEHQIKEQFHRAFDDVIKDAVLTENHDYIVRLYTEIRDRIAGFVTKNGKTYRLIHGHFDVPFFEQLLRTKQFDWNSMAGLINTTYKWLHDIQMPIRDRTTKESKQKVLACNQQMSEAVALYVKEVHLILDIIEKDMREFFDNKDHPVVKHMLSETIKNCKKH